MYYTPGHLCPGECSTSLLAIFVAFPVDNAILPFMVTILWGLITAHLSEILCHGTADFNTKHSKGIEVEEGMVA